MKIAVMQPYIFPYIGYFQLINAVDRFIFLDDVNFIKRGWINRNQILLNDKAFLFSIPLRKVSQNKAINQTEISYDSGWQSKLLMTLEQAYKDAPNFSPIMEIVAPIITKQYKYISEAAAESIKAVCEFLDEDTEFLYSSVRHQNKKLKGEDRIIDICREEEALVYVNAAGGRGLYNTERFKHENLKLYFLNSSLLAYPQYANAFLPNLSIIDVLMFNEKHTVRKLLTDYTLL